MHRHRAIGLLPALALVAAACGSGGSAAPTGAPSQGTPSTVPGSAGPSPSAAAAAPTVGPGEGQLNIIIWAGYAEDGSNVKEYDWVHPFEQQTGCKVNAK